MIKEELQKLIDNFDMDGYVKHNSNYASDELALFNLLKKYQKQDYKSLFAIYETTNMTTAQLEDFQTELTNACIFFEWI
jgi:hypothetical protein